MLKLKMSLFFIFFLKLGESSMCSYGRIVLKIWGIGCEEMEILFSMLEWVGFVI